MGMLNGAMFTGGAFMLGSAVFRRTAAGEPGMADGAEIAGGIFLMTSAVGMEAISP